MSQPYRLLTLLADGRVHSGVELGRMLGVEQGAVRGSIRALRRRGLEIRPVRGRGYRLGAAIELLDAERIRAQLGATALQQLDRLEVLPEVDSTNHHLLRAAREQGARARACFAEYQSAGRGRRGRSWCSPLGGNLYLSLSWIFSAAPSEMAGLSLALGTAVADTLAALGERNVQLKWPNDLVRGGRKLGGLLIETLSGSARGILVVAGVGLNVAMVTDATPAIDQLWAEINGVRAGTLGRNRLAARLLAALLEGMTGFEEHGFAAFREAWARLDAARGHAVTLHSATGERHGTACGVDPRGALLVDIGGRVEVLDSGEISMRVVP